MSATFLVGGKLTFAARPGVVITRSQDETKAAYERGERWSAGDRARCGDLVATVVGIERYACFGPIGEHDGALLLRGVDWDRVEQGQEWVQE